MSMHNYAVIFNYCLVNVWLYGAVYIFVYLLRKFGWKVENFVKKIKLIVNILENIDMMERDYQWNLLVNKSLKQN